MIRKDIYRYDAEEGNFIIRNSDNKIMGETVFASKFVPITNYHEEPYTEESYRQFYESIGVTFDDETTNSDEVSNVDENDAENGSGGETPEENN